LALAPQNPSCPLLLMSRPLELALIKYDPVMNRKSDTYFVSYPPLPLPPGFFSGILVVEYCFCPIFFFSFLFFLCMKGEEDEK